MFLPARLLRCYLASSGSAACVEHWRELNTCNSWQSNQYPPECTSCLIKLALKLQLSDPNYQPGTRWWTSCNVGSCTRRRKHSKNHSHWASNTVPRKEREAKFWSILILFLISVPLMYLLRNNNKITKCQKWEVRRLGGGGGGGVLIIVLTWTIKFWNKFIAL